jgi:hypothetical protein
MEESPRGIYGTGSNLKKKEPLDYETNDMEF